MTRIRKNWSSSRGTEDVESPPSHAVVNNDSHMADVEGKPQSPLMVQLVDEDAMQMLAAVSLGSLEQDSGIRNLKRENASAQVMAAMSAKSLERDLDMQNKRLERASAKIWDQPVVQASLLGKPRKTEQWCPKLKVLWDANDNARASPAKVPTKRDTLDEEQSKTSSVADNEVVDSDLSARVERAKRSLAGAQPIQNLISGLIQARLEREPGNEETSRVLQELVYGHGAGRKKRPKPWESESDLPSTVVDDCRTDEKAPKSVNGEVNGASVSTKRRLKIVRASLDQRSGDRDKIRAEPTKVVTGDGNLKKPWLKPADVLTDDVERNQPKAIAEEVGDDVDDRSPLKARVEKVDVGVDDRKKPREKSEDVGTDSGGDRKRFRAKVQKVESNSAPQNGAGEDIFPTGWKYKGLAQIAEKDEATNGQVKKLCGRTDGHNWRCPLRVVEGHSLCQHHLNKARAKKMGKSNQQQGKSNNQQQRKEPEKKSDEALVSPHTSDSGTFEQSLPSDHHVPTKSRRRHKTAKLSVL